MIRSGLVSITFRELSPTQIIDLAVQAGLSAIEWGGDRHIPHGDTASARRMGKITTESGLSVSAYGSYYRVGHIDSAINSRTDKSVSFEAIAETTAELEAPKIRVWAGKQGSDKASPQYFEKIVQDSRRIAEIAQSMDIQIAYEYHGNTLTDTDDAARRLLETVKHSALRSFWQPRKMGTLENDLAGIEAIKPWLADVHVFSWHAETGERLPLHDRSDDWKSYFRQLNQIPGDRFALLEFVQNNDPTNLLRDAAVLKRWLKQ